MYIIQKKKEKTFLTKGDSWSKKLKHSRIFKRKFDLFEFLKRKTKKKTIRWNEITRICGLKLKDINIFGVEFKMTLQKDILKEFKAQQTLKELEKN